MYEKTMKSLSIKQIFLKPDNLLIRFTIVLPIIISQALQRIYPIVNNRYLTVLGHQALYVHNVVYNFLTFGQFVGLATYISCLVFWRRQECIGKQGGILVSHLIFASVSTSIVGVIGLIFSKAILIAYKVNVDYLSVALIYLRIGLLNMILIAIYCGLDGMLVASQMQKRSMFIAFGLLIGNVVANKFAVYHIFKGINNPQEIYYPMLIICLSTTLLLVTAIFFSCKMIVEKIDGWGWHSFKTLISVWGSEFSVYLIRGMIPFIFTYQLCFIQASPGFLITYQLALQLSYILCLPLIGAIQIAIRDAAASFSKSNDIVSEWWPTFFYTGIIPTTLLLSVSIFAAVPLLSLVFDYSTPLDHIGYLAVFFFSCWVGQWGNAFTIPIRAMKKNYLVAKNFFSADFVMLIGGTQLLILMGEASPEAIGYLTLLFSFMYLFLNFFDANRLVKAFRRK